MVNPNCTNILEKTMENLVNKDDLIQVEKTKNIRDLYLVVKVIAIL